MLDVQNFKYPYIVYNFYDHFLTTYERFPWNDEVPHYFVGFNLNDNLFENMNLEQIDLPTKYYGVGKGFT